MRFSKSIASILIFCFIFSMTLPAAAAAKKKKSKKPPQPIEIVADEMYFSDKTGELFARGNVVITQDKSKIYADIVRGNDKQTEMWVDGKARLIEPRTDLVGIKIRYNYGAKFGAMQEIKGQCGDDFISASKIHFENGKYTAYNATTTGCPAKGKPDYRVTAKKVVIWPEDKMIAYDAKIWIKDFVVYTTPKYVKSLKKGDKEDEFPSFGYQDPDGFWIKQHLRYPVTDSVSFATDLYYFTNKGFKPTFELLQEKSDYSFKISAGDYSSTNSSPDQIFGGTSSSVNWVTKAPEFEFKWNEKQIGQFPWRYRFSALIGRWTDAVKTSWHHDYLLYFTRDPIYFDKAKTWTWNNGFGLEQVRESYDNSVQNIIRYNSSLAKRISPRVTVWAAYNYTNNNQSAFAYNSINVAQEWVTGIYVQLDKKTGISYSNSYDIVNGRTYENYYTIYRNMHCWNTYIQYQEKQKKWVWNIAVVRF